MRGGRGQSGHLGGYHRRRGGEIISSPTAGRTRPSFWCCVAAPRLSRSFRRILWLAYIRGRVQGWGAYADRGPDIRPSVIPSPLNILWFHSPNLAGGYLSLLTSEARVFSLHGRLPDDANLSVGGMEPWHVLEKKLDRFPRPLGPT